MRGVEGVDTGRGMGDGFGRETLGLLFSLGRGEGVPKTRPQD